jgi:hypothetical protein
MRGSRIGALRQLDVTLLHGLVLEGETSILGLDAHREAEAGRWSYTKDERSGVAGGKRRDGGGVPAQRHARRRGSRGLRSRRDHAREVDLLLSKIATGLVFNPLED